MKKKSKKVKLLKGEKAMYTISWETPDAEDIFMAL